MKIEYVEGNLLETPIQHYVQGCNAQGVMGSGVAKLIRDRHPEVFEAYRGRYEGQHDYLEMGDVIWVDTKDGKHRIGNVISQEFFGGPPTVYADYDAIDFAYSKIDSYMEGRASRLSANGSPLEQVAMPLIGAGLAGGSWKKISGIIEARSRWFRPVVYLLQGVEIPTT